MDELKKDKLEELMKAMENPTERALSLLNQLRNSERIKKMESSDIPDRKREDPKTKRINKASSKSRAKNSRISGKKRKLSHRKKS